MVDQKKAIRFWGKACGVGGFLKKERRLFLWFAFLYWVVAVYIIAASAYWPSQKVNSGASEKSINETIWDWNRWDEAITLFTLGVGVALFLRESIEDWEQRLPSRLTVYFLVNALQTKNEGAINEGPITKRTIMVCYYAHLPHEGDIRTWSQQIGRQMSKAQHLDFSPYLDLRRLGVETDQGEPFVHYQAVIYLQKLPETLPVEYKGTEGKSPLLCMVMRHRGAGEADERPEDSAQHYPQQLPRTLRIRPAVQVSPLAVKPTAGA